MNVQDYKNAGYDISVHVDQTKIDRAEADVMEAYLEPLGVTTIACDDTPARAALMALAFLCVLQRSTTATRAGAKEKTTMQSLQADRWTLLEQWAETCKLKLNVIARREGVKNPHRVVTDICGIYFSTHFLGRLKRLCI